MSLTGDYLSTLGSPCSTRICLSRPARQGAVPSSVLARVTLQLRQSTSQPGCWLLQSKSQFQLSMWHSNGCWAV